LINIAAKHPNARTRNEAVQWVGRLGDAYTVTALEEIAFEDQSMDVQMEALDALRNLPDKVGIPSLVKLARTHTRTAMRSEAVQWLGRLGDAEARPTLVQVLYDEAEPSVQMEALDALGELPRGISTNLPQQISTTHPNAATRREAMQRLVQARESGMRRRAEEMQQQSLNPITANARRIPDGNAPRITDTYASTAAKLEGLILEDEDPSVQEEAFEALLNVPGDAAQASLMKIGAFHLDKGLRDRALDRLKEIDQEAALEDRMQAALDVSRNHPDADQRGEAVQALKNWPSGQFFTVMTDIAFTDPSQAVQEEALDAIRDRSGLESWARLARIAREHPNAVMRSEAVQSLDGLNTNDLLDVLEEILLSDPSLDVRMEALDLLVEQPKARSLPLLRKLARRPTVPDALRNAAADELEDLR
jgi:HEAT repeat protein